MKNSLWIWCLIFVMWTACTDWRRDAFEDKRFDPSNAFVRFNYENTLSTTALDSIRLPANVDTVIFLPIALSAPNTGQDLEVFWETNSTGWRLDSIEIQIDGVEDVQPILIEGGTFDEIIQIVLPAVDSARFEIEIIEVSPELTIGYPRSNGRGAKFSIIVP